MKKKGTLIEEIRGYNLAKEEIERLKLTEKRKEVLCLAIGLAEERLAEEIVIENDFRDQIDLMLSTLKPREEFVIRKRLGLDWGEGYKEHCTLEEIGAMLNLTRERIRQIEAKTIRKLKHPSRKSRLEEYTK